MTAIKFYADEHVRKQVIDFLKNKSVDIISTDDVGNKGKLDIDQLKFAASNKRAVLTRDPDYLVLKNKVDNYGIFFITRRKPDKEIVKRIISLLEILDESDVKGAVVYI